jgi:ABC-type Fe3+-hydroxamate transport system substrate-binding protein
VLLPRRTGAVNRRVCMRRAMSLIAAMALVAAVAVAQPVAAAPVDNPVASVAKKKGKKKKCKIKNSRGKCVKVPKLPPIEIVSGAPIINGGGSCPGGCRPDDSEEFSAKR